MITKQQSALLDRLCVDIRSYMSPKRLAHTYSVEKEVTSLCEIYAPEAEFELRAAALLHDITKELPLEKQLQLCREFDIMYSKEETLTPKIFHSRTAPAVVSRDFGDFAISGVLDPIRWHTTGRSEMDLREMILFLADFIEKTRTFESCVLLREYFYDGLKEKNGTDEKRTHLIDTMILAFDLTFKELIADGVPIHPDTVAARNYFIVLRRGGLIEYAV